MILSIDLFAMVEIDDEDDKLVVLYFAKNTIVADAGSARDGRTLCLAWPHRAGGDCPVV